MLVLLFIAEECLCSADILKDYGLEWVILGHSERRSLLNESSEVSIKAPSKPSALEERCLLTRQPASSRSAQEKQRHAASHICMACLVMT